MAGRWRSQHDIEGGTGIFQMFEHQGILWGERQQHGFGGMITVGLGSLDAARRLLNHVHLCSLAESLGGVETLISHPGLMTHASMPADVREKVGITEGLVRISVGIEEAEDLIADLDQALGG